MKIVVIQLRFFVNTLDKWGVVYDYIKSNIFNFYINKYIFEFCEKQKYRWLYARHAKTATRWVKNNKIIIKLNIAVLNCKIKCSHHMTAFFYLLIMRG